MCCGLFVFCLCVDCFFFVAFGRFWFNYVVVFFFARCTHVVLNVLLIRSTTSKKHKQSKHNNKNTIRINKTTKHITTYKQNKINNTTPRIANKTTKNQLKTTYNNKNMYVLGGAVCFLSYPMLCAVVLCVCYVCFFFVCFLQNMLLCFYLHAYSCRVQCFFAFETPKGKPKTNKPNTTTKTQ